MLPEALAVGRARGLAGGVIGALVGGALASDRVPRPRAAIGAASRGLAVAMLIGYGLQTSPQPGRARRVSLTDVGGGAAAHVSARIELSPRDAADDAAWLTVTAWQGGGFVLDNLERVEPGVYRTTKPIPVHGEWKALLRLHRGNSLQGVPIYLPRDPAIPAAEVPAERAFVRTFVPDKDCSRGRPRTASPVLSVAAYGTVLAITLSVIALNAWALVRLATVIEDADAPSEGGERFRRTPAAREPVPAA